MTKKLWFKAKTYGWGWTPCSWEGWLVTGVYVALIILLALTLEEASPIREVMFMFVLPVVLLTITLMRIAYARGEKPTWRWGNKN